ncbi:hypothetical protein [Enterococcus malodoratus]|uniref:LPXTG-domain-containing protein cell wall anchor domain n=1 Tax=Enterococcus malodoratus ATCC 43197 TaxID=1158601 RepID=R2NXF7_9ENTE|nr:hypothetical protein [Enterococcus malodoratus]EOH75728.1 hypothetical protein UAI_02737 [Enterococcus malodoratus ATCC 43197]EOT67555.1 hypothetical protein I585_03076 [Enterococcus malodoratus ATCC 43197]OJG64582.1 hypothetical protein RV07_GL003958 [Enterococcus malodoratus]SPX03423.1 Uncharacterised protein [Enterococcus malodoratus]STD69193.1 Uncharacterised protein [Enterococcus malodoratus]
MNKKRPAAFVLLGVVSSAFLLLTPIYSCAASTTSTSLAITFSNQEQEKEIDPSIDLPVIKTTKTERGYETSYLTKSDQRRLPMTGEEYSFALYCLGWATLLFVFLFFFIGIYEREGRENSE